MRRIALVFSLAVTVSAVTASMLAGSAAAKGPSVVIPEQFGGSKEAKAIAGSGAGPFFCFLPFDPTITHIPPPGSGVSPDIVVESPTAFACFAAEGVPGGSSVAGRPFVDDM